MERKVRKSQLMLQIERSHQEPLEQLLPRLLNEKGPSRTADFLGVSKATIGYWQLKLGISIARIAVTHGDQIIINQD